MGRHPDKIARFIRVSRRRVYQLKEKYNDEGRISELNDPEQNKNPLVRVYIAIKGMELDTPVSKSAHQRDHSYYIVYNLFDLFRQSKISLEVDTSFTHSGEIEMDESNFLREMERKPLSDSCWEDPRVLYRGV
jgi:hypothetical protein